MRRPTPICGASVSPANGNLPIKYSPARAKITTVTAIASGLEMSSHCHIRSAFDRNLIAAASYMNPSVTLKALIHDPDFGSDSRADGNSDSSTNGIENAPLNATMPTRG